MIVPSQIVPYTYRPNPAVSLEEYARYTDYSECELFGVKNAPGANNYECRGLWTLSQRQYVQHYLSEAQQEIEDYLGYFLSPDWVVGDIGNEPNHMFRFVDQQTPRFPNNNYKHIGTYRARWKHINAIGTRGSTDIELGATVNHASDPAVIVTATTLTDVNEIKIYHPGSDLEINPSEIILDGVNATISIPRCRMVLESLINNSTSGIEYTDTNNFEQTVDIKRVYTDSTVQATLVCETCGTCTNTDVSGCIRILNNRQGTIEVNTSNLSCVCGCVPTKIGFNYYCGDINTTQKAKEMIIRLANSKMPSEPCGCEILQRLWQGDREVADILTAEQTNNPFGIARGAVLCWQWAKAYGRAFSFGEI